jgi:hypothetical protein
MRSIRLTICILVAALAFAGSARLSAQDNGPGNPPVRFIPEGETVYDIVNHVTWLAEGNLAKTLPNGTNVLFGLTVCPTPTTEPTKACVNADGSMSYTSALAWISGMNDASYLGHDTWQLPTAPMKDHGCTGVGPAPFREGFAFDCDAGALGYLLLHSIWPEGAQYRGADPAQHGGAIHQFPTQSLLVGFARWRPVLHHCQF